ncbi:hypothetical protein [Thermoanaerobacter mathranii]|uniref:hypothetical protein n=1 Tax=Thermoanaerobacter mathranii TaxID=583357 RepID=UPI003D6AEEFE
MILGAKESQKTISGELVFRAQSDINITDYRIIRYMSVSSSPEGIGKCRGAT